MGFFCSAFQHLAATICVFAHPPSKQTPKAKKPATSKSTKSTKSKGVVSKQTPATKQSSAKVKKEVGIVVRDTVALSVNPLGANRRR